MSLFSIFLGLIFGSFIAALSWRYPKRISIAKGRSICPNCNKEIGWFDNIPVISYIILGGHCRNCGKRISIRYPFIEVASGLGFLYFFTFYSSNIFNLFYYLIIFLTLLAILVIDFEHKIIPDDFIFFGIGISLLFLFLTDSQLIFLNIFSGLFASFLLLLIHLATSGRGMGLGDVKFAIFGGLLTGLNLNLIWLFLGFLTGGITGVILILGKRAGMRDQIAFGPFLVIALGLTFLFGDKLLLFMRF